MKVYLDLIIVLNIALDFLILLTVSIVLKRNVNIKRIILASLFGGLSIFLLFVPINTFMLFVVKLLISMVMVIIAFSYKNKKYFINNMAYLYMVSIILGGFLYFLRVEFSYKNEGVIFFNNGMSINFIVLLIISPIILYIYIKESKMLKLNGSYYHKVDLYYKNKCYKFNGFLDTGNKLYDQYKKRPIVLIRNKDIKFNYDKGILVPYHTASGNSLLKCLVVDSMIIDGNEVLNPVIGLSEQDFNIDGVDMILHNEVMGGRND
jgi:Sporulation factor SpoIIGA.